MSTLLYFAYGSNLHPLRLARRVPSSEVLTVATLSGHALRFHKRGGDASGKCNVLATGATSDQVLGVVYRMDAGHRAELDRVEGPGYRVTELTVQAPGGRSIEAFCYMAEPHAIDDALQPFSWYKALVVGGARVHRFPHAYLRALDAVSACEDPDPARAAEHFAIAAQPWPLTE